MHQNKEIYHEHWVQGPGSQNKTCKVKSSAGFLVFEPNAVDLNKKSSGFRDFLCFCFSPARIINNKTGIFVGIVKIGLRKLERQHQDIDLFLQ